MKRNCAMCGKRVWFARLQAKVVVMDGRVWLHRRCVFRWCMQYLEGRRAA